MFTAICTWVAITAAGAGSNNTTTFEQQLLCRPAQVQLVRHESFFALSKRLKREAEQARIEKQKMKGLG